jgi:hypothetical protein
MVRRVLGYALLAVVVILVLRVALGLFGFLVGLAVTILSLTVVGYGSFLILRAMSPGTASRLRDLIAGLRARAVPPARPPRT